MTDDTRTPLTARDAVMGALFDALDAEAMLPQPDTEGHANYRVRAVGRIADDILATLDAARIPSQPDLRLCGATQQTVTWGEMWCGLFAGHEPDDHHWFSDRTHARPSAPASEPRKTRKPMTEGSPEFEEQVRLAVKEGKTPW